MTQSCMTAKSLIETIRFLGGQVKLDGERVTYTPPPRSTREERASQLTQLKLQRDAVVAFLVGEERWERPASQLATAACGSPSCAGCYSVGPDVFLHPPRGAYHYEEKGFVK